jgi:hypothetical protein
MIVTMSLENDASQDLDRPDLVEPDNTVAWFMPDEGVATVGAGHPTPYGRPNPWGSA